MGKCVLIIVASVIIVHTLAALIQYLFPEYHQPKKIRHLTYKIWRNPMSKVASVQLKWTKSATPTVTKQVVTVVVGTEVPVVTELLPSEEVYGPFNVAEDTSVNVTVVTYVNDLASVPAVLDFNVGVLTPPEAVTGLAYEIVAVTDVV